MYIRPFEPADEAAIVVLWKRCGLLRPWNDPHKDIARKQRVQPELFLVGLIENRIVATVMAGFDGHRGWINYLAVEPSRRRQGYGRLLMAATEERLLALGCPKINLQIRHDNLDAIQFYERLGFSQDAVVSLGKRLISDN
ncbi:GNAT family acetyltransferase [Romeria aff. gracilis LEGE 07310]|uniref:GNAT family acetyltransferase n=1 Tax=Vasconcelosia minhoensis LEGE 07310 TaxID=915328 RepID=A0A8J7AP31_9CYAN|nr:GNAT family acetyltransferase [Romeria gracilis]MBE9078675.1 GNAT family acetyltransferase [Romeria aff. gracilis LEGE 07310]